MLITLDTNLLIKTKLDAHQFVSLKLIQEKEYDILREYLSETSQSHQFLSEIPELVTMGYLLSFRKEAYDFNNLQIADNFIKLISGNDLFQELVMNYPKSVVRPDGNTDYLLTDLPKAKNIYTKLVQNNKMLHEHILSCLKQEIDDKESNDSMKFMKRLPKWISDKSWETYNEQVRDLQSVNGSSNFGYGTTIE